MIERDIKNTIGIYILVDIVLSILTFILIAYDQISFAIIVGTVSIVVILFTLRFFIINRDKESMYRSFLKNIYKTYETSLINSKELPDISGKNVLSIASIYDLLDAQIEIKKPIYYKEFEGYTVFVLIDNDEACVTIFKLDESKKCEYEEILDDIKSGKNSKIDNFVLEELANTAIIQLDNGKAVKVSPIREKLQKELVVKKCIITKTSLCCISEDNKTNYIKFYEMNSCKKKFSKSTDTLNLIIKTDDCDYKIRALNNDKTLKIANQIVDVYLEKTNGKVEE